jgi:hypothetical protein
MKSEMKKKVGKGENMPVYEGESWCEAVEGFGGECRGAVGGGTVAERSEEEEDNDARQR